MFVQIEENEKFSMEIISALRKELEASLSGDAFTVVIGGSFGRHEASSESDCDFFVIHDSSFENAESLLQTVREISANHVSKPPSKDGPFAKPQDVEKMLHHIGGEGDSNSNITRRILFMLECEWLYNKEKRIEYLDKLINKYVKDDVSSEQIGMFFLNDVIRYYRTVCVDFEFKTREGDKPWGDRNIKLVFSRKLLYFGGILATAELYELDADSKRERLRELLLMPPIQRMRHICNEKANDALELYDGFLKKISDPEVRKFLKKIGPDQKYDAPLFRDLKDQGHKFTDALIRLLDEQYDNAHPIHHGLLM